MIDTRKTPFREQHLGVPCSVCGAGIGRRCRGNQHSAVLSNASHSERAVSARVKRTDTTIRIVVGNPKFSYRQPCQ